MACLIISDFPDPAGPVRKIFFPDLRRVRMWDCSGVKGLRISPMIVGGLIVETSSLGFARGDCPSEQRGWDVPINLL